MAKKKAKKKAAKSAVEAAPEAVNVAPEADPGMQLYRCHKLVRAFKIKSLARLAGGDAQLFSESDAISRTVSAAWVDNHKPQVGGYFVQYDDGYISWSPAQAFEDGYTVVAGGEA